MPIYKILRTTVRDGALTIPRDGVDDDSSHGGVLVVRKLSAAGMGVHGDSVDVLIEGVDGDGKSVEEGDHKCVSRIASSYVMPAPKLIVDVCNFVGRHIVVSEVDIDEHSAKKKLKRRKSQILVSDYNTQLHQF